MLSTKTTRLNVRQLTFCLYEANEYCFRIHFYAWAVLEPVNSHLYPVNSHLYQLWEFEMQRVFFMMMQRNFFILTFFPLIFILQSGIMYMALT